MHVTRYIGVTLLTAALLCPALALADSANKQQARAELDALRNKIDKVRDRMASDSSQRSQLSSTLEKAQQKIAATRARLDSLDRSISAHKKRIDRLTAQRNTERDQLSQQLADLGDQVRGGYETGRLSRMRLLLSGESPEKVGRMLAYFSYFADAQSAAVAHLKTQLARLVSKQQSLENEKASLASQRETRAATLARLESNRKQQQATVAALDKQLSSGRASLADMKHDEQQLEQLLNSVQRQLSSLPPVPSGTPFYQLKGRMHPPVQGRVLAHYGQRKGDGPLVWQGEWIAAPQGTPIHAVAGGRVVYVGYMKRYGLIVIIDHGHGYYSLYGHAAASYVDIGDEVRTGQSIATAGHSGGHDTNGAYFEIRHGQKPVNPQKWLSG
ncbi:MAG: peptidoglycan DD-metalloendopeptidase family protein [Salinisphaera sp.]|nr:peptidoglycan DD-metalloendopeptidase family protein [Salinisphaera sp.]